jgi:hypothetical protein
MVIKWTWYVQGTFTSYRTKIRQSYPYARGAIFNIKQDQTKSPRSFFVRCGETQIRKKYPSNFGEGFQPVFFYENLNFF